MPQGLTDEQLNAMGGGQGLTDEQLNAMDAPAAPAQPSQPGFFRRVASDYMGAARDIIGEIQRPSEIARSTGYKDPNRVAGAVAETGLRVAGKVAGAAFAPIAEGFTSLFGIKNFVGGAAGKVIGAAGQKYSDWASKHPEAAKDLGAAFDIGSLLVGGEGESAAKSVATEAKQGIAGALKGGEESAIRDVYDVVKPKLSSAEESAAKAEGRATTEGIMKKTVIQPTKQELEMAKYAKEAGVKSGNTFDKNIAIMKQSQKASADLVRQGLKDSKAIWNENEFKGVLNKIEEPITVKSDATLANQATHLKNAVDQLVDTATKKPEGILDVRQKFDRLIQDQFGSRIFSKDDPFGKLVRSYRKAMNDFAESKIPDGALPGGKTFKGELRRQSLLYDAIDNVSETAPKVGESARPALKKAGQFIKKHKTAIEIGAGAVGVGEVIKHLP